MRMNRNSDVDELFLIVFGVVICILLIGGIVNGVLSLWPKV